MVGRKLYAAWLGCSQLHDAEACLAILSRSYPYIPDWIIVDHYGLDSMVSMILKSFIHTVTPKIFVIDDLADRSHHADLLLTRIFSVTLLIIAIKLLSLLIADNFSGLISHCFLLNMKYFIR